MGSSASKLEEEKKRKEEQDRHIKQLTEEIARQVHQQKQLERERGLWEQERRRLLIERETIAAERRQAEQIKRKEQLEFLDRLVKDKVTKNLQLINDLRVAYHLNRLEEFPKNAYEEKELESLKFTQVANVFKNSNKPCFTIEKITSVNNIFNELHFKLNREIYRKRHKEKIPDLLIFHGTKQEFLHEICTYNFDRSKVRTHKFGHGVSFARDSYFATHYHRDNKRSNKKVMIIAKALLEKLPIGNENTIIPEAPYCSSTNEDMSVIVKYDDASAYPLYIVYYEGFHPPKCA
ncbi:unnamed protein product [Ceutorhynchus assimilis]|uniref:PARP catalytic domain-containing protein n=1 Tax=Ceutorhynchus assimilis TaxID=467358 RepID=A0A9N9QCH9_9CUCU|nr:unnamed protein product [Ceutorhynchus assimilis]